MRFDGKVYAEKIYTNLQVKIEDLKNKDRECKLIWISSGEDSASRLYGKLKSRAANSLGIKFVERFLVENKVDNLKMEIMNAIHENGVTGVMVQLPVIGISKIDLHDCLDLIPDYLDVDCLTSFNMGKLLSGNVNFLPATVASVGLVLGEAMEWGIDAGDIDQLLKLSKPLKGVRITIIGGGWEVGKPLVGFLSNLGATVLWVRSTEVNLKQMCEIADVVISATGVSRLIKKDYFKMGSILIDVGAPESEFEEGCYENAKFYTPVPGGVGPITVACLMGNVIKAVTN